MYSEHRKTLKEKANKLPLTPGVYIMKDAKGKIIYIGKAKALKNRVTQYFGSNTNHSLKVSKMVSNVDDFETILCDTEYEALMLENSLIKQHQPKYNILLKDDKGYHYIKITNERWPKIQAVKNLLKDGSEYIGPYYSASITNNTVEEISKIYKLPNCNRSFDTKTKPCLNYHIGLCFAPCTNPVSNSEYIETINSAAKHIKNGGISETDINNLREAMEQAADKLDFEKAAKLRDRLKAIEKSKSKQKVIISSLKREDIIASVIVGENTCVSILIFNNGHLTDKKIYFFDGYKSKSECYAEFLQQYYQSVSDIPSEITLDADFDDAELISEWLTEKKGARVSINIPKRSTRKELINMCISNAAQALSDKLERKGKETEALCELSDLLGLPSAPKRIEAYDISNTAGSENVASMIVFTDGRYNKNLLRKFKIKSFVGQDDYRSMHEVLDRRFSEYIKGEDESFKVLPDLILLDGGKGQLSAVMPLLEKYNISVPIFGMVKDSKHKTKAVTALNGEIQIKENRKAFTLVTTIQNEVHRTAVSFHHSRTKSASLKTELTEIKGVGEATAKKLIKEFKSLKNIKNADINEFINRGFSEKIAKGIIEFYKK